MSWQQRARTYHKIQCCFQAQQRPRTTMRSAAWTPRATQHAQSAPAVAANGILRGVATSPRLSSAEIDVAIQSIAEAFASESLGAALRALQESMARCREILIAAVAQMAQGMMTEMLAHGETLNGAGPMPYAEDITTDDGWDPDFDPREGLLLLYPDGTVPREKDVSSHTQKGG